MRVKCPGTDDNEILPNFDELDRLLHVTTRVIPGVRHHDAVSGRFYGHIGRPKNS